ncbi:hypothetical protein Cma02nite_10890 [Cellulomonas marina]|nr:hypothetical protein Cma02nite_10890 [Cellulomonas marina]
MLVLVAVVLGGLWWADGWAGRRVRDGVALAVAEAVPGARGEPEVVVHGWPVLTQLVAGRLERVDVRLDGATLDGVDVTDVSGRLRGVSTGVAPTAEDAVLHATVPVASLQALVDEQVDVDTELAVRDGALTADLEVLRLPVRVELGLRVEDARLLVDVVGGTVASARVDVDDLPGVLASRVQGLEVPVAGLPAGLALTDAEVVADGVRVRAAGTDVVLTASS